MPHAQWLARVAAERCMCGEGAGFGLGDAPQRAAGVQHMHLSKAMVLIGTLGRLQQGMFGDSELAAAGGGGGSCGQGGEEPPCV